MEENVRPVSTFLQIDLQNLFTATNHGQKLDLEKIWDHFNNRESEFLIGSKLYTVRGNDFDSSRFETKIKMIGYDIVTKNIPRQNKKYRESNTIINLDMLIAIDCFDKINQFDKWILMSNNGVFIDLCRFLKARGKKIEVWGFQENYDPNFELHVDRVQFINDNFCLKKPNISVFGINWGLDKLDSTAIRGN